MPHRDDGLFLEPPQFSGSAVLLECSIFCRIVFIGHEVIESILEGVEHCEGLCHFTTLLGRGKIFDVAAPDYLDDGPVTFCNSRFLCLFDGNAFLQFFVQDTLVGSEPKRIRKHIIGCPDELKTVLLNGVHHLAGPGSSFAVVIASRMLASRCSLRSPMKGLIPFTRSMFFLGACQKSPMAWINSPAPM